MILILKVLRTLFAYLFLGVMVGTAFLPLLPFIRRSEYAFRVWYTIDVLICSVSHGTTERTISGWTGEHMQASTRYLVQGRVINFILRLTGDSPLHCERAYEWEVRKGKAK
jgi:hypothetical protein